MGEVIQFPTPEAVTESGPQLPETCDGILHIFDEVPGTCRCGEETWTPEGLLDPPGDAIGLYEAK